MVLINRQYLSLHHHRDFPSSRFQYGILKGSSQGIQSRIATPAITIRRIGNQIRALEGLRIAVNILESRNKNLSWSASVIIGIFKSINFCRNPSSIVVKGNISA